MSRTLQLLIAVLPLCLVLSGCGGGGGGRRQDSKTAAARFAIVWGTRSRVIEAPASALSATVTLAGAASTGGNLVTTVNRSNAQVGYTGEYVSREPVKLGAYVLTTRFFAGADGTGDLVGEGTANVTITANGTGIDTMVVAKEVATVQVVTGQVVPVGTDAQLQFTARDASGRVLALSPGSAVWTMPSPSTAMSLTLDGVAAGVQAGGANVVVTVDGVASPPTPVSVSPAPLASLMVDPYQFLPVGWTKSLTYSAKDTQGNVVFPAADSIVWSLVDGESILRVTSGGTATALQAGTAHLRVSSGGIASAPEAFTVLPPGTGMDVPAHPPYFVYLTGVVENSYPFDLSRDGSVAVGYSQYGNALTPVSWRDPSTFAEPLAGLSQPTQGYLTAVSADGTLALGAASANFPLGIPTLFRLDGGQTTLPLPPGNSSGTPVDLSADGTVALCTDQPQTSPFHPKPYVVRGGTAAYLPLPTGTTKVNVAGISGDGSTVVGTIDGRAVRWVDDGAPEFIAGSGTGASGVSFDGRVVVGNEFGDPVLWSHPFRWTPDGGAQPLPTSAAYPKSALAIDVSDDGRVVLITGDGDDGLQGVAQLWHEGQGTRTLAELYGEAGGNVSSFDGANPRALSGDGRTIIGHGKRIGPGSALAGEWKLRLP